MSDTMTLDQFAARLDALDDDDLIGFLEDLEDGTDVDIPHRQEKMTATVDAIQRRPFAAYLRLDAGQPVTAGDAVWAVAREAVWGRVTG